MNPREVVFGGVERPNAPDVALRQDLMREHAASKEAVRAINERFVPRLLPVTMSTPRLSAKSWDLVIAVNGGTIYLPKLGPADAGDEVHIVIAVGTATIASEGVDFDGSNSVTTRARVVWGGVKWWRW